MAIPLMEKKVRLLELDCLRAVAILMVLSYHLTFFQPLRSIFVYGCTGVELFFMISGFVIFMTIEQTKNYKTFLFSRFVRLFPTFWFCVTLTSAVMLLWAYVVHTPSAFPGVKVYLINLTMVPGFFHVQYIDWPYWTLALELLFYLFILIVYLLRKTNRIEFIGLCIVLFCVVYEVFIKYSFPGVYTFLKTHLPIINFFPLFIAGIIFYKVKFFRMNLQRAAILILCLVTQMLLFEATDKMPNTMTATQYALIIMAFFLIFTLFSLNYLGFIINKYALHIGKISYSLYLFHAYIGLNFLVLFFTHSKHFHMNDFVADFAIVLPILIFTATLINKFIEGTGKRFFKEKI